MDLISDWVAQILLRVRGRLSELGSELLLLQLFLRLMIVANCVEILAMQPAELRLLLCDGNLIVFGRLALINEVAEVLLLLLAFGFDRVRRTSEVLLAAVPAVVAFAVRVSLLVADLDTPLVRQVVVLRQAYRRVGLVVAATAMNAF